MHFLHIPYKKQGEIKLKIDKLQQKIDDVYYWDAKVLDFNISFFGDEIIIILENDKETNFMLKFLDCYKVEYETDAVKREIDLSVKNMNRGQLAYYAHDITIQESLIVDFIEVNLTLAPLFIKIICKDIQVEKVIHDDKNFFWDNNIK